MGVDLLIALVIVCITAFLLFYIYDNVYNSKNVILGFIIAILAISIECITTFLIMGMIEALQNYSETDRYFIWWSMKNELTFIASMLFSILILIFLVIFNSYDTKRDSNGNSYSNSII